MLSKNRSASFSGGTALPVRCLVGQQRQHTVSSFGNKYVSWQALRSQLHTPDNVARILGERIINYKCKDGSRVPLQHWLDLPMLVSNEQLAKLISIEESKNSSPVLKNGSICYFRSWPMRATQLSEVVTKLVTAI